MRSAVRYFESVDNIPRLTRAKDLPLPEKGKAQGTKEEGIGR